MESGIIKGKMGQPKSYILPQEIIRKSPINFKGLNSLNKSQPEYSLPHRRKMKLMSLVRDKLQNVKEQSKDEKDDGEDSADLLTPGTDKKTTQRIPKSVDLEWERATHVEKLRSTYADSMRFTQVENSRATHVESLRATHVDKLRSTRIEKSETPIVEKSRANHVRKLSATLADKFKPSSS